MLTILQWDPCAYSMLLGIYDNDDSLHGSFVHNFHSVISEILHFVCIITKGNIAMLNLVKKCDLDGNVLVCVSSGSGSRFFQSSIRINSQSIT